MSKTAPKFSILSERQSRLVLRQRSFGRLAFTFKDRVDIEPIGYVLEGDWLYGRTSPGTKLVQLAHHRWVAFEVDEVGGPFDWKSVVVHGAVYFLNRDGDTHADFARALKLFRRVDRRVLEADDPAPFRTIFFRIHIDDISGRAASTKRAAARKKRG
jgi:uncharacterized protein